MQTSFDYIIVGAGSAGCVLARRLIDTQQVTVCLIEAGASDSNPCIHIPFGVALLARMQGINWNYNTVPQTELNQRALFWPRGKVMGGSSSVNAMCYIRGQYSDYDDWEASGAVGWNAQSVLPFFTKSEDNTRGESLYHGIGGPLGVSDLRHHDPLSQAFIRAGESVQLAHIEDFNTDQRVGVGLYQVSHRNGQRCSTAKGFIEPVKNHPNLTIITDTLVHRVLLSANVATGVECAIQGKLTQLYATKEVLLSGGAINSPQILMLSGIGNAADLAKYHIECVAELPGVGQHLQDHLDVIVQVKCQTASGYALMPRLVPKYIQHAVKYVFNREGLLSSNVAEAGGFATSRFGSLEKPDLQFHFIPGIIVDHGRGIEFDYGFGVHVCHLYPKSQGYIGLRSNNPTDHPDIQPNYLSHEDDLWALVDGVKLAMKILSSNAFSSYSPSPWQPVDDVTNMSDEQIIAFIRAHAQTVYHPVGTCRMGQIDDPNAVVDPNCNVKYIDRLRVVDASVMPSIIGGNTNAPTIMIAEKIAQHIIASF